VGTVVAVVAPVGVKVRLLVRLIVKLCPAGTVITTGDQPAGVVVVARGAFGFNGAQVAVEPATAAPQVYPHIGTVEPSGSVTEVGPAVKLTLCWAAAVPAPRRRTVARRTAGVRIALSDLICISVLL
jgi:hypothetical protein